MIVQPEVVRVEGRMNFGPDPVNINCPHCQARIMTATKQDTSVAGWLDRTWTLFNWVMF